MTETITYSQTPEVDTHNMSLKVDGMKVPYSRLVELFGEPQRVNGDKTRVQWVISFSDGETMVIYDWKDAAPVEEVTLWNVASRNTMAAYRAYDIIAGKPIEI